MSSTFKCIGCGNFKEKRRGEMCAGKAVTSGGTGQCRRELRRRALGGGQARSGEGAAGERESERMMRMMGEEVGARWVSADE
jgi:hypothetical protein